MGLTVKGTRQKYGHLSVGPNRGSAISVRSSHLRTEVIQGKGSVPNICQIMSALTKQQLLALAGQIQSCRLPEHMLGVRQ